MGTVLAATAVGFGLGLAGTAAGGLLVLVRRRPSPAWQTRLLGLAGGIMLAVSFFDLWPSARRSGGLWPTGWGTAAGVMLVGLLDFFLPPRSMTRFIRAGLLLGLGIGAHNFPEGVALGTAYTAGKALGGWFDLGLLMALHNIPEGMVMAAAFRSGGLGPGRVFLTLAAVELPMALGAGMGAFFGQLSSPAAAFSLAFAAGAMVTVVVRELLPAGEEMAGRKTVWGWTALGLVLGMVFVRLL